MAIIQEAFDIPDDIMMKILSGELRRIGGVVRRAVGPNKGQIVKLLEPADQPAAKEALNIGAKALQYAKTNKKALLVIGIGIAGGTGIYYKIRNYEPKVIIEFKSSLQRYLDVIRKGKLSLDEINTLITSLENMKLHKEYEKFRIRLSAEDFGLLVNRIYDYTTKLAQDNSIELAPDELSNPKPSDNAIIYLQNYLKTQKRIFEEAE